MTCQMLPFHNIQPFGAVLTLCTASYLCP